MKTPFPRRGILAALYIPTDRNGRVIKRALAAHLAWLRAKGVHGVLALGSTGEFIRMTLDERKAVLELVAELAAPLPVIANISDINPRVAAELGRFARKLKLPGVGIMPPSFFPVTPADQLAFFLHVAEASDLPVMLYNFPELTCNRIAIETIAAFADRADMAAIKQSGGEFTYHPELIALGKEKDFSVFSGADTRLEEVFKLGALGCIGGLVNFVPEYMLQLFRGVHEGAPGDLAEVGERMRAVGRSLDKSTFPLNVPAGIEARGLEVGVPKTVVSVASQKAYIAIVKELKASFKSWKLPAASAPAAAKRRSK